MENERQIWLMMKEGSKQALHELYELYYQTLYQYGNRITADPHLVQDAIQETFISLWRYGASVNIPQSVRSYLLRAFRNHLITLIRKRNKTELTGEIMDFNFEVGFESKIIEGERIQLISSRINLALSQLTSRQREIIYYRFFEEMSFDEIGRVMDMQTRGTYKLMARALAALKQFLEPDLLKVVLLFAASIS